jgi:hypothetical protein
VSVTTRHIVRDTDDPSRVMRVRFDAFVERLLSLGDPDRKALAELLAGADLVLALENESENFGRAAPGIPKNADHATAVLAITDEAFAAAHELIGEDGWADQGRTELTGRVALAHAVAETFDSGLHEAITEALLSCPPETEAAVAKEFV